MTAILAMAIALISGQEATSLPALSKAVAQCDRGVTSTAFRGEEERRTHVIVTLFTEQLAIAEARTALADRRAALRAGSVTGDSDTIVNGEALALADRQSALDDSRQLERLRQEAMDQLRRQYLAQCNERGRRPAPREGETGQ